MLTVGPDFVLVDVSDKLPSLIRLLHSIPASPSSLNQHKGMLSLCNTRPRTASSHREDGNHTNSINFIITELMWNNSRTRLMRRPMPNSIMMQILE